MFGRTTRFVACLLPALLASSLFLRAQDVTGALTGVVKDATGASVPAAKVSAINSGTKATFDASTDENGTYTIRTLPPGVYNLTVDASGFKHYEAREIRLQVNETLRLDADLQVGAAAESVTVTAQAVIVDTQTPTLKTVVDQKRIEELPLNGRNATQLVRLVVGVVTDPRADVSSGTTYGGGVVGVSVNGSRANSTNYVLDGASNNDHYTNAPNPMPNPDALQEFSVQTNNFSAEFGRQSGGLVNAVTKSGTNDIHGSAFEFVRNNALNATNYFAPVVNGERATDGLKRNQYGVTLGGPVYIPKLYDGHNKTFFFFSYQGTKQVQAPSTGSIIVPTAAQRLGNFGTKTIKDPATGLPFPNNQIPTSQLNPISLAILQFIPLPTAGNSVTLAVPNNFNDNQYLGRVDQQLGSKNRLSGRFWNSAASTPAFLDPADYLANNTGRTWLNRSVSITDTHIFSPTLLNEALFSFNRTDGNNVPIYPAKSFKDLGINIFTDNQPQYYANVVGYFGTLNTGDTNKFLRDEFQAIDTLRWTKGKHSVSFGGEYGRGADTVRNNFRANGRFTFGGTSLFTGDGLADFLLGKFVSLQQGGGEYRDTRFNRVALFVNDTWKITPRLTLTLGVRWEPFLPYTDLNGKVAVWEPGKQSTRFPGAPPGVLFAGDQGIPAGGVPSIYTRFAPRVGFAYDVFGDGKTSIRGGYGMFFDSPDTLAMNNQSDQAPYGTVVTIDGNANNNINNPYAVNVNPFPIDIKNLSKTAVFPPFSSQWLYASDYRSAYVSSWNLSIEREVINNLLVRVSYAGSKGTRLTDVREINQAVYAPGVTTATTNARRPYGPALGSSGLVVPVGNSVYHALQFTAEKRFSRGFTLLANYQFAKSIDDASGGKGSSQTFTNPNNQRFDRGPSDFDKTHVANISGLWDLPVHFQNKAVNSVLGGWTLNGIFSAWSGYPFSVTSGVDNAFTGTGGQRADLIGNPNLPDNRSKADKIAQWLNATPVVTIPGVGQAKGAFAPNAVGTFGVLGRNTFRGPGYASLDGGLAKRFVIYERLAATFRFEAFNSLNRTNLTGPTTTLTSGNFMKTTTAYDPRILQLALRLTW